MPGSRREDLNHIKAYILKEEQVKMSALL